jgi:hypothetical protein
MKDKEFSEGAQAWYVIPDTGIFRVRIVTLQKYYIQVYVYRIAQSANPHQVMQVATPRHLHMKLKSAKCDFRRSAARIKTRLLDVLQDTTRDLARINAGLEEMEHLDEAL